MSIYGNATHGQIVLAQPPGLCCDDSFWRTSSRFWPGLWSDWGRALRQFSSSGFPGQRSGYFACRYPKRCQHCNNVNSMFQVKPWQRLNIWNRLLP